MVGIADLFASSAPQTQPVQNASQQGFTQAGQQAQIGLQNAQAAVQAQDVGMKQRAMQISMLNGVLALPPEKQQEALSNVIPMANRLGPTQFDQNMTPETAKMYTMSQVPAQNIPEFALDQAQLPVMQAIQQRLAGTQPAGGGTPMPQGTAMPDNGQITPGGGAPIPAGGGQPIDTATLESMAASPRFAPMAKSISDIQNQSPQGQANIEAAKEQTSNVVQAQKGVVNLDTRLGNAINILDDMIKVAPNTYSGGIGELQEKGARNLAAINPKLEPSALSDQTKFVQDNANLFTQELPAVLAGLGQSKVDIPLVNAIKDASQVYQYAAPNEKITAAQNLKGLLLKAQENAHQNAAGLGAGNTPIPKYTDTNPPGQQKPANAQDHFDTIQNAKQAIAKGAPAAAVRQRLQAAGIDPATAGL